MEEKRPLLLTIISWLIIIGAVVSPVTIYMGMNNPQVAEIMEKGSNIPMMVQYGMIVLGAIVGLWSAIGMLSGKKQARTVYVAYSIVAFAVTFVASNLKESLFMTLLISAVILGLLYLPNISRYFNSRHA